ncbi:MAG: ParB/RepB/Spo0J family partition protein [Candidatus Aminicenantes bacterium]|jgi:ParB family chromosome partitioning protein
MKKKALGKGLEAFLSDEYGILKEERYIELETEKLRPNPLQPRMKFDPEAIDELAQSIKETGILQPIVAVPDGDHYRIIVGERRWRAAKRIGLKTVPTLIRDMTEEQQLEAVLVENLQREDLNPLEIASTYKKMTQDLHLTQEQVAAKVGKDRASVANYIRLLKLPQRIRDMLAESRISMGHARTLLPLENPADQVAVALQAEKKDLSVRAVERLVAKQLQKPQQSKQRPVDPNLTALEEELLKILGTKVSISGNMNKGMIRIYYYSSEELDGLFTKIKGKDA